MKKIPVPETQFNKGIIKYLSCSASSDNPNVKVKCVLEDNEYVIYASANNSFKQTTHSPLNIINTKNSRSNENLALISFDTIPACGDRIKNIIGTVSNIESLSEYGIIVLIFNDQWRIKPHNNNPITPIQHDGSWRTDITTNVGDHLANKIAAFIVPNDFQISNDDLLLDNIAKAAIAKKIVTRYCK